MVSPFVLWCYVCYVLQKQIIARLAVLAAVAAQQRCLPVWSMDSAIGAPNRLAPVARIPNHN